LAWHEIRKTLSLAGAEELLRDARAFDRAMVEAC